jgi:hypothetical protein
MTAWHIKETTKTSFDNEMTGTVHFSCCMQLEAISSEHCLICRDLRLFWSKSRERYMVTNVKSLERRKETPQYALAFIAQAHPQRRELLQRIAIVAGGWGELQSLCR